MRRRAAAQACQHGDAQACRTRDELDRLSQQRQAQLQDSCLQGSAEQCRANLAVLAPEYAQLQAHAQELARQIALTTDPAEVARLKQALRDNDLHLRQVSSLLKTQLEELAHNKGGLSPNERLALAQINADTSGRQITESLIGAAILGKEATRRVQGDSDQSAPTARSPAPLSRDEALHLTAQRDADLTTPVVARTPGEQIRNVVNTTAQHPSQWTVQIGGRTVTPDPALSKNQPVYSGVSDADVMNFVNSITGGSTPTKSIPYTVGERTATLQVWDLPDGTEVVLRPDARSTQQLGPHWTVEIKSDTVYRGQPGKERAIEFKFIR